MTKSAPSVIITALIAAMPLVPQSQSTGSADTQADPPARVARLNWISGDVSFQPAGLQEWSDAALNYPLTTSDHLFVGWGARAELHIGPNAIRLGAGSNFGFLNLDDSIVQLSLSEGSMEVRIRQLDENDAFEVATPNGSVTLLAAGDYRIDTDPGRDATMLTVRGGQAELFSGGKSVIVRAEQTAYVHEDQTPDIREANGRDAFDAFTESRDESNDAAISAGHIPGSEQITGAEDLSTWGTWETVREYGDVWVPPVAPDWAPYSDGNWNYVEPWGWTWIDVAPWGFAPFHYGRWAFLNAHWVWVPGPKGTRQVYAPALVVFVGGGTSSTVSWYPLAPREAWTPPWRELRDPANPPQLPRLGAANRQAPGAIHAVSQLDFISGTHVRPRVTIAPDGEPLGSSPQVPPTRQNVLPGPARMPPLAAVRPLIARTVPPPAPVLFEARQGMLRQNRGRPLAKQQVEELRREQPAAVIQRQVVRANAPLANAPRPLAKPKPAQPKSDKSTQDKPLAARPKPL